MWTPAVVSSIGSDISDPYTTDQGCSAPADPNVGGEWAYHCNSSSHRYGIGAVGFGFFSESDRFDTAQNLGGPVAVDGGNFSLAPEPATLALIAGGHIPGRIYPAPTGFGVVPRRRRAVR